MTELKRELGLFTCILLVIGNIIGVGIFTTPGEIAIGLPSAGWVLLAWVIGGVVTLAGALTYGELGAMFPKAGGNYVFLKEAFGPLVAFLYGLAYALITTAGTIALLSIGFAGYLGMPSGSWSSKIFSIIVVMVLTFFNYRGVKLGAGVMNVLTLAKLGAMLLLVGAGFALGKGETSFFRPLFPGHPLPILIAIGAALVPMAYTYSGWDSTVLVGEEVKRPESVIPFSLILGTLATTLLYVLMNAVYLYAVPLREILGSVTVADQAARNLFAPWAANFTKGMVALSVLGCLSATMLSNPRIIFAMGRDGLFLGWTGKVHPKYQTPSGAILFESICGCLFILWGNFGQILSFLSAPLVIMFALIVCSIYVFRFKRPEQARPYKCWGYPYVPAFFVVITALMIYSTMVNKGIRGVQGILVLLGGIPIYYLMLWYQAWRQKTAGPTPS